MKYSKQNEGRALVIDLQQLVSTNCLMTYKNRNREPLGEMIQLKGGFNTSLEIVQIQV